MKASKSASNKWVIHMASFDDDDIIYDQTYRIVKKEMFQYNTALAVTGAITVNSERLFTKAWNLSNWGTGMRNLLFL